MSYNVPISKRVIPTGIDLAKFDRPEIGKDETDELREQLGIASDETMLLSLSRISREEYPSNRSGNAKNFAGKSKGEVGHCRRWTLYR